MQSLTRAIKRGNAVIAYDGVTRRYEPVWRKGTEKKQWRHAKRNSMVNSKNINDY